jgi:hypothetical protein
MSVRKGPDPTLAASAGQARREPEGIGLKPLIQSGRLRGRGAVSEPRRALRADAARSLRRRLGLARRTAARADRSHA